LSFKPYLTNVCFFLSSPEFTRDNYGKLSPLLRLDEKANNPTISHPVSKLSTSMVIALDRIL